MINLAGSRSNFYPVSCSYLILFDILPFTVKPGVRYRELGNFIQKHAQSKGCSVTKTYCGHGIHRY